MYKLLNQCGFIFFANHSVINVENTFTLNYDKNTLNRCVFK